MTRPEDQTLDEDERNLRLLVGGVAWLVGYACARRTSPMGLDGALAEADRVATHFATRIGWLT